MNLLEQQLNYPLGDTLPELGSALAFAPGLAPGIKWIRMGLPFALDHINLWLLRDELDGRQGWTIVDCCVARDESKENWEKIFATALEGLPVLRVIVTHMHPDHIGLASWLCERWTTEDHECRLWISATDFNVARLSSENISDFGGSSISNFFASHGLTDQAALEVVKGRSTYYSDLVPSVPRRFRRMMDGQKIRIGGHDWTCISGYGHAPEHIALYCADVSGAPIKATGAALAVETTAEGSQALPVLISGDMVLPRISTNISVYDGEPESNPLALFLESIDKFKPLNVDTLTLPSHGKPFRGLHIRVQQLHDHHRDRLAEVVQACEANACSAADIVPVMFKRQLDAHQITFAIGEALAHLNKLWLEGVLRRHLDGDGIYRFSPV